MPTHRTHGPSPGRVVGLYALTIMEEEGVLYGYALAERIAQVTDGTYRPGAGAIYPALEALEERRLARSTPQGRRRLYRITREGREVLARVRRGIAGRSRGGPELGLLWSEIAGHSDPGEFLLGRLQHQLDAIGRFLDREAAGGSDRRELRRRLAVELRLAQERIRPATGVGRRRREHRRGATE